jgi:hypothetical protein
MLVLHPFIYRSQAAKAQKARLTWWPKNTYGISAEN